MRPQPNRLELAIVAAGLIALATLIGFMLVSGARP